MKPDTRIGQAGFSLVEIIMVVSVFSMIFISAVNFFNITQRGYAVHEAHTSLKTTNQIVLGRLGREIQQSRRLFDRSMISFAQRINLNGVVQISPLTALPIIEVNGSLSPESPQFVSSSMGNSLLFASVVDFKSLAAADSSSVTKTLRFDTYVFRYYFLAADNRISIDNNPQLMLWRFVSPEYVDYNQISQIQDSVLKANCVRALSAAGISQAWDASATDVNNAFYDLSSGGTISADPSHQISAAELKPALRILIASMNSGFKYGVAPNGKGFQRGTTSVFPLGFSGVLIGQDAARQVLVRLVLMAEGAYKSRVIEEQTMVQTVKDVW